jgi:hypothetical protein
MSTGADAGPRYRMVNVQPGYVIIERERFSGAARSYFSGEPVPPKEEYVEGSQVWSYAGMAQSFQFDVRDESTGAVTPFRELLGLLYYGCCREDSDVHRLGVLAHELDISVYVAITYEAPDGSRLNITPDKIRILNQLFNERLRSPGKKILILPDLFDLYKEISHGQIAIDFGLTSMEQGSPEGA